MVCLVADRYVDRVANYVRFRPKYPHAILPILVDGCGLTPDAVIADIGSGTGLSSEPFLANGNVVYGVEPSAPMREAAEQLPAEYPNFVSVDGSAEVTGLGENSVDLVVAGTAFHWFDREKSRTEFHRILRPGGHLVVMWNERDQSDPLQAAYDACLRELAVDYNKVGHRNVTADKVQPFFAPTVPEYAELPNEQKFDFDSFLGRSLSSSYTPNPEHSLYTPFVQRLRMIFGEHQADGMVAFRYMVRVFFGRIS